MPTAWTHLRLAADVLSLAALGLTPGATAAAQAPVDGSWPVRDDSPYGAYVWRNEAGCTSAGTAPPMEPASPLGSLRMADSTT